MRLRVESRLLRVLAGVGLAGILVLAVLVKYSTSPAFCRSCHIMEPYYKAWKSSQHNRVACVECHYPPGSPRTLIWKKFQALSQVVKYVTRTYSSKPFAEVNDESCLRSGCHSTRLLQGKVVTKSGIRFDHRPHITERRRGRQLRCVSCHSQVVVGKHIEVTYDTCFLCHFRGRGEGRKLEPLGGCLGCHELPARSFKLGNMTYNHKDFVTRQGVSCQNCHVEAVQGKGRAPEDRCLLCHNQPEKLARYGDIPFIHDNHVTKHNIACFHCHEEMRHGFPKSEQPLSLSGGHPSTSAPAPAADRHPPSLVFDCGLCHEDKHLSQLQLYSGKPRPELGALPELPSPMYLAHVDCNGCHYRSEHGAAADFGGRSMKPSQDSCAKCHGAKFRGILSEMHGELASALAKAAEKLAAARAALAKQSPQPAEARAGVRRAERLLGFLRAGHGEHNIYLASVILRTLDRELDGAGRRLKAELPDISAEPMLSGAYCARQCHGRVGVKVPPETVRYSGKTMPHLAHTEMTGCVDCHDIGGHKRVPLRRDVKARCAKCHDGSAAPKL